MSKLLDSVISDMQAREEVGMISYGTTLDRDDLDEGFFLQAAYEEMLDAALYLKKIITLRNDRKGLVRLLNEVEREEKGGDKSDRPGTEKAY